MQTPRLSVYAERLRSWEEAFKEFIEVLCRDGNVLEVYLTGSRARGESLPYSDYDVVVIVKNAGDLMEEIVRLRGLRKHSFPLDLIVLTASDLKDPLYEGIIKTAVRLC
ncbi:MAG: nucleotidyltransferase domain-containing protein [Desulfurococcus sp.]|nr:nucleotidyltransferase domain-containing protein [Desulfurococcus sp.]